MTFKQATNKDYTEEIKLLEQVIARLSSDEDEIPSEERDYSVTGSVIADLETIKRQLSQ
jgi:hypothetical protein